MKILSVDDNKENRYMLEVLLKSGGHNIISAKNGEDALKKLENNSSVDLIISDILMPVMDGFQLCLSCKMDDTLKKIPFVFYTGTYIEKDDKDFGFRLGVERYLIKPLEPEHLLETIDGILQDYQKGLLASPKEFTKEEELILLKQYNSRLMNKLEKKVSQLEKTNQHLQESEENLRQSHNDMEKRVIDRTKKLQASKNRLSFYNRLLKISNEYSTFNRVLNKFTAEIKKFTGCEATGIRILEEDGEIPYMAYQGFSQWFYETESPISIKSDQCMCINVIKGTTDPKLPFYSRYGSFYMNGTTRFLATVSEKEKGSTRNVCNQVGYESVALVPIKTKKSILGLIHMADSHENMVPIETVAIIESAALTLSAAIQRIKSESDLQKKTHALDERVKEMGCLYDISHLLNVPDISMGEILQMVVDRIPLSWRYPEITCARIFLEDKEYKTKNYKKTKWYLSSNIRMQGIIIGLLEVCYLKKPPESDSSLFIKEEKNLTEMIAERLKSFIKYKKIENSLMEKEVKARALLNATSDAVILVDTKGLILDANKQFAQGINKSVNEIIDTLAWDYFPAKVTKLRKDKFMQAIETKEKIQFEDGRNGTWYSTNVYPLIDPDGKVSKVAIFAQNITRRKAFQNQLIQSERLIAAGQLSASIAHEINSPLQGINSLVGLIKEAHINETELIENIELIEDGFKRIQNTVRVLLNLNRPEKLKKQPVSINEVIKDVVSLLKTHLTKNKIEVNCHLSSKAPIVNASQQQMGQIFLNLFNNATEAMLNTKKRKPLGYEIAIKTYRKKDNLIIEFYDTGPGLSENDMESIFDPFYTQKTSMGMGIGLSICNNIIKEHNGMIEAGNRSQGGAVFKITLPAG